MGSRVREKANEQEEEDRKKLLWNNTNFLVVLNTFYCGSSSVIGIWRFYSSFTTFLKNIKKPVDLLCSRINFLRNSYVISLHFERKVKLLQMHLYVGFAFTCVIDFSGFDLLFKEQINNNWVQKFFKHYLQIIHQLSIS